jgi:hypothetical protein
MRWPRVNTLDRAGAMIHPCQAEPAVQDGAAPRRCNPATSIQQETFDVGE